MEAFLKAMFLFCILVISMSAVVGLRCYTCSMDCAAKSLDQQGPADCDGVCTKNSKTVNGTVVITRGCDRNKDSTPGCTTTAGTVICVCDNEDLCNGSALKSAPFYLFMFLSVFVGILNVF